MNLLVSILMPVYKTASYLREAVDSMLAQTFTDFELIVLNDCSPDNAEAILDTYDDPRIVRYKGEKNVGLSNVLNVGLEMARGKYVARMDSDDISLPERLQIQVDFLESHPDIDLVSVGMKLFGAKEETWVRERDPEKVKINALFHSPVLHASSMWRRDSFEKFGLRFRQEMVPSEDYDLWTRALLKGLKLVNLPEVLYEYRIHDAQASLQTEIIKVKDREVQKNYMHQALPSLSTSNINSFPKKLWPVFFANLRDGFFDRKLLAKRLYKINRNRK
ncbi:MAG: glycosyltransferase [Bacteroidales bacterium]|nr:glycosyltransferase [Bacteroidales bacterium]